MASYIRLQLEKLRLQRFNRQLETMLPDLFKLAAALTGRSADAEDLVHDACVKALTACTSAKLPNDQAIRAWVRRILINQFRDHYRRERRSPIRPAIGCDFHETGNVIDFAESPDPSPEDWVVYDDLVTNVRRAVAELPPEVRIVTTLFMVGGCSYKEIAATVDTPIGTVMSRLSRGRRLLNQALNPEAVKDEKAENDRNDVTRTLA